MPRSSPLVIPFSDPVLGAKNLRILGEAFVSSGTSQSLSKFMTTVEGRLRRSPDPDRVLAHVLRFVEASFGSATLFTDLTVYPATLDLLLGLFGHSQFLGEMLIRDPEFFDWLREDKCLTQPVDPEAIAAEIQSSFRLFSKEERRLSAVKRIHRRELLRISAQDILGIADLASGHASIVRSGGCDLRGRARTLLLPALQPVRRKPTGALHDYRTGKSRGAGIEL